MPERPADHPLAVDLAGIRLRNPVVLAAGTAGTLDEIGDVLDLSRLGAIISKSITPDPRAGNDTWRLVECRGGMLNAIGLANPGIDAFAADYAPRAAGVPAAVFASAAGFSVDDFVRVAAGLEPFAQRGIPALELNVSCPNVHAGMEFGSSPALVQEVVRAVRSAAPTLKLILKLSPLAPEPTIIARAAILAGASALTVANTVPAMAIDVRTRRPRLSNGTGGLSGPAIHPIAVRLVHQIYRSVAKEAHVPILAAGGVMTWHDAAEFILAGATAVQMGTATFVDPRSPLRVVAGLEKWVRSQGASSVRELVGAVLPPEKH